MENNNDFCSEKIQISVICVVTKHYTQKKMVTNWEVNINKSCEMHSADQSSLFFLLGDHRDQSIFSFYISNLNRKNLWCNGEGLFNVILTFLTTFNLTSSVTSAKWD